MLVSLCGIYSLLGCVLVDLDTGLVDLDTGLVDLDTGLVDLDTGLVVPGMIQFGGRTLKRTEFTAFQKFFPN